MTSDQKKSSPSLAEPEPPERLMRFAESLCQQVLQLRIDMDTECEEIRTNGEVLPAASGGMDMGLSCIHQAALDVEWYAMMGLTAAAQDAISRRDSQAIQNWAEAEEAGKAERRAKREAAKQRRLAKQAGNQQGNPE